MQILDAKIGEKLKLLDEKTVGVGDACVHVNYPMRLIVTPCQGHPCRGCARYGGAAMDGRTCNVMLDPDTHTQVRMECSAKKRSDRTDVIFVRAQEH